MLFTKTNMHSAECYISGRYKCVQYGKEWFAYFIPAGWENWGNSCERTNSKSSKPYKTLAAAKDACRRHFAAFPSTAAPNDKLLNNSKGE